MKNQHPTERKSPLWRTLLAGVLAAALFSGICASNIMYAQDTYVADALYQHATPQDGQIVLINIDQKSLDALGPFQSWGRALMGDVINTLNQDPQAAPAVIALDVLYVGDSGTDMQTAKNAGLYAVGVTWGFRSKEVLLKYGADVLVHRPEQILQILDSDE